MAVCAAPNPTVQMGNDLTKLQLGIVVWGKCLLPHLIFVMAATDDFRQYEFVGRSQLHLCMIIE